MTKKIYHWSLVKDDDPYKAPELVTLKLHGLLDSEDSEDSDYWVRTSTVVGKRGGNVVTNSGSEYELVTVNPEYENVYPNARERLFSTLKEV